MRLSKRREALREYILDVAQDLVVSGVIRQRSGQPITEVIISSGVTVLNEVRDDLLAVFKQLGVTGMSVATELIGGFFRQFTPRR